MNIWSKIQSILTAPLTEDLDTPHLFLLVGLVIVSIGAWLIILNYMTRSIEEL